MNRKQLEECAWKKTPKDERRAQVERYDWKAKKSTWRRLTGNAREVLVFDPSGTTEGTINAWVPLWSLYSDELEQRCKEGRLPKLRAPYNRMRADYTGDVESSPGTTRHHATKKSRAQLQREIDEVLAKPRSHATKKSTPKASKLSDVEPGLRGVAHRMVDAENRFLTYAMEHGRLSRAQAETALAAFRKARVIKFDAVNGTFHVTHGQFLEPDVLRRAAGVEE